MDKVIHHVLILTGENALIYIKYDHSVTHLEVYQEFHKLGVEVKDCYMQQSQSYNLAEILLKAVNKWVLRNFEEAVERNSVTLKNYAHKNQNIIMDISGRTESGKPFVVKPSELLSPKINFFSDFC